MSDEKDKWLTKKEFAELLTVSLSTINRWLADPENPIPQGAKFGSGKKPIRRWKESQCIAFMESQNASFDQCG